MRILRYGLMKRLKRGKRIYVSLTFRCQLDCVYCSCKSATGKMPVYEEIGGQTLIDIITNLPFRVREIVLSGGEPMVHRDFVFIYYELLKMGYFVTIFTNLVNGRAVFLNCNRKARITTSYHLSSKRGEFLYRLAECIESGLNVKVDEFPGHQSGKGDRIKPFLNINECMTAKRFCIAPDGKIYTNFGALLRGSYIPNPELEKKVREDYLKIIEGLQNDEKN